MPQDAEVCPVPSSRPTASSRQPIADPKVLLLLEDLDPAGFAGRRRSVSDAEVDPTSGFEWESAGLTVVSSKTY